MERVPFATYFPSSLEEYGAHAVKTFICLIGICLLAFSGQSGTLITYGGMSKQPVTVPTSAFVFKDITVRGFWLSQWNQTHSRSERQEIINKLAVWIGLLLLIRVRKTKYDIV
jgi:hypothetical protein